MADRITYSRTAPDDTEHTAPASETARGNLEYTVPHYPAQLAHKAIDSFLAMQIGLWQILSALEMYSIDVKALLGGTLESRAFRLEGVTFDWANVSEGTIPHNTVALLQEGATSYTYPGRETVLIESTIDQFCEGTVLKKAHTAEVTMQAIAWMGHKDDRGGLRRALEDAFDEPMDDRAGRRVTIPQYWGQTARYELKEIDYQDSGETAMEGNWPLVATFACDIDVVKLVKRPGFMQAPQYAITASEEEL